MDRMKNIIKKIVIAIVAIAVFAGAVHFYIGTKGNPYYRYVLKNEAKVYLEKKYGVEAKINGDHFDWKASSNTNNLGLYLMYASLSSDPEIRFIVGDIGNRDYDGKKDIRSLEFHFNDKYVYEKWRSEAKEKLSTYVESLYEGPWINFISSGIALDRQEYEEIIKGKSLEFKQIRDLIASNIWITVGVNRDLREDGEELEKALKVIKFIKEEGFKPEKVWIKFNEKQIFIEKADEELSGIQKKEDLERFIEIRKYY